MAIIEYTAYGTPYVSGSTLNTTVSPYMRSRQVMVQAIGLRPNRLAQYFFGGINVTRFMSNASKLIPDASNAHVASFAAVQSGERFYCPTTGAFGMAVGASNGTIYLDESFSTYNVNAVGANTVTQSYFNIGDIVYQGYGTTTFTQIAPAFQGQVVYWDHANGHLILTNSQGVAQFIVTEFFWWFYNAGRNVIVNNISPMQGYNRFPIGAVVTSLDNVSNKFVVSSYEHRNGSHATGTNLGVVGFNTANVLAIQGPAPSDAVGNVVYITSGPGLGQVANILSVHQASLGNTPADVLANGNATLLFTDVNFNPYPTGNGLYSIGSHFPDAEGCLSSIFNLPETSTVNFKTGSQQLIITDSAIVDDPFASMSATGTYTAYNQTGAGYSTSATPTATPDSLTPSSVPAAPNNPQAAVLAPQAQTLVATGSPNSTYQGIMSTVAANAAFNGQYNGVPIQWPWALFDVNPVAQVFTTPPPSVQKTNYGIFCSSVDIWFSAKPSGTDPQFPVQLFLVEAPNGIPTSNAIASAVVQCSKVQISPTQPDSINIGTTGQAIYGTNSTVTRFSFADPVYLAPATKYAIVLYSESPDYEAWVATIGALDISTGGKSLSRISPKPNVGGFFKSQNASAWTPYNNAMLMFVVNQAIFNTLPESYYFIANPRLNTNGVMPYDKVVLSTTDLNFPITSITYKIQGVYANDLTQETQITTIYPGQTYNYGANLAVSSLTSNKRRVLLPGNSNSVIVQVTLDTPDANISPLFSSDGLSVTTITNMINRGGVYANNITITNPGSHSNAANITVTISPPDLPDGTPALANVIPAGITNNTLTSINLINFGSGYSKTPTITIGDPHSASNATIAVAGEDQSSGGNGLCRYISEEVTLAQGMDAGDMRIFLTGIRPAGTDICVYYKVMASSDTQGFINVPWQKMSLINDINSTDQTSPIALVYAPALGTNGQPTGVLSYMHNGTKYPLGGTFKYFAIKIVLFADDPSVFPSVGAYRAIVYPPG